MVEGLEFRSDDGVVEVVLAHGEDNLLSAKMCEALTERLRSPAPDEHVLRLRAEGTAFCLGRERVATTPADLRAEVSRLVALNQALGASRLVTVAQVHADAAGFGVGLAALCDVTVAAPSAGFRFPEVDIDLAPVVVLAWLPRLVGRKHAFRMTATGARIDAAQAAAIGLVTAVAPADERLAATVDGEIAGLRRRSPRVHAEIKDYLRATADLAEPHAYDLALDRLVLGSMARRR